MTLHTNLFCHRLWPPLLHKSSIHIRIEERHEQKIGKIWTKKNNIKFFFIISCGLQPRVTYNSAYIFFFSLLKALDNAQSFLGYVLLKVFTFYLFTLQHHLHRCALHHRRDYDEQRTVVVVWTSSPGLPIKCETRYTRKYPNVFGNLYQMRLTIKGGSH